MLRMGRGTNLVSVSREENVLPPKLGSAEWVRNRERVWKRQWEGLGGKYPYIKLGAELHGNYEYLRKPKFIDLTSKNLFQEACPGG